MRLSIRHDTTYNYDDQVRASIQYLRLTPQESARQRVISWQLDLPRPVRAQRDPYGNILHVLTLDEPHEALVIGARGQVASRPLVAALRALAADDEVTAVVLRIDSPGGSALASEQIWQAVAHLKSKKPVVASMGGVAASGGKTLGSMPSLCKR